MNTPSFSLSLYTSESSQTDKSDLRFHHIYRLQICNTPGK